MGKLACVVGATTSRGERCISKGSTRVRINGIEVLVVTEDEHEGNCAHPPAKLLPSGIRTRINGLEVAAEGTRLACGCIVAKAGQSKVRVA